MDTILHLFALTWKTFWGWSFATQVTALVMFAWCALITFYVLYIATINVWDNRSLVSWWVVGALLPLLVTMVVVDVLMNWTLFTLITLDLPREAFVTSRMKRYRAQTTVNWHSRLATFICTKLLNPFDPTKHHC